MTKRVPGSHRTREALRDLMESRYSGTFERSKLVHLATRLIIEEGPEAEVRDALDRDYYEHGSEPGGGYRNGARRGRLKIIEGLIDYAAPQVAGRDESGEGPMTDLGPRLSRSVLRRPAEPMGERVTKYGSWVSGAWFKPTRKMRYFLGISPIRAPVDA